MFEFVVVIVVGVGGGGRAGGGRIGGAGGGPGGGIGGIRGNFALEFGWGGEGFALIRNCRGNFFGGILYCPPR